MKSHSAKCQSKLILLGCLRFNDPFGLDDADRIFEEGLKPSTPPPNPWYDSHNENSGISLSYDKGCRREKDPSFIPFLSETGFFGNSCLQEGWKAQARNFPNGDPSGSTDPYGGAYRHCVSTCSLVRRYGFLGGAGRVVWDWTQENPTDANSQLDMAGEDYGEAVASGCQSCEKGCLEKYPSN